MFQNLAIVFTLLLAGALRPEPVNAKWWYERHEAYVKQARTEKINVLFLGDSITDFWRGDGKQLWQKHFAPLTAANFGIGGDKVENVLWRVQKGELKKIEPRVVVLLIGTNNLPYNNVDEVLATHVELIAEIHKRLPKSKLLLLGVFPRVDDWSKEFRVKVEPLNAGLAKLADERFVYFLNFGERFKSADGGISPKLMYDGLHLTEAGYEIWVEEMLPTLNRLLGQ